MYGLYRFLSQIGFFFQDLFTDNTKMPKNRLPAQPLWQTIMVKLLHNLLEYGSKMYICFMTGYFNSYLIKPIQKQILFSTEVP